ncbi:hypothetical protein Q3G72_007323 [Acer saccharum]|nr:hypothetical protein Q3G72_007323 [Acer saccharum]
MSNQKDQAWKYGVEVEMEEQKGYKYIQSKFCDKVLKGGVYHMKEYLTGVQGSSSCRVTDRGISGPMNRFVLNVEKDMVEDLGGNNQQGLKNEARQKTCIDIARFFYENGLAFNVNSSPSFVSMLRSVGSYGRGLKPPTAHELSNTLLIAEEANTQEIVAEVKKTWSQTLCPLCQMCGRI